MSSHFLSQLHSFGFSYFHSTYCVLSFANPQKWSLADKRCNSASSLVVLTSIFPSQIAKREKKRKESPERFGSFLNWSFYSADGGTLNLNFKYSNIFLLPVSKERNLNFREAPILKSKRWFWDNSKSLFY